MNFSSIPRMLTLVLAATLATVALPVSAADPIPVVATFSILGDLVKNIGGDRIAVDALIGPNGDAHVYTPSANDARKLANARIVFANGLGFEGWLDRFYAVAGPKAPVTVASKGVKPRIDERTGEDRGKIDPHAWQSIANVRIFVANIRDALIAADPSGKANYETNAMTYVGRLNALEREINETIAKIPADRRGVISNHDAFGYFQDAYGITFSSPQGLATESEPSAGDVAAIIDLARQKKARAIFLENISNPRLMQQVADESGMKIGGTLYGDALTGADGEAPTYIALMQHNVKQLSDALMK